MTDPLLCLICAAIGLILGLFIAAVKIDSIATDCDKIGATRIQGVVYDCKRRDAK